MTLADTVMKAMGPCFLHRALLVLCLVLFTSLFFAGASSAEVVISAHTDAPDPVAAHGIVTYTIVVSNNTFEVPFSNVTVTDIIPATTQFVDVTPPASVSCAGVLPGETGTLTCTGLSLAAAGDPGDSVTYLVRVRTTSASRAAGTITNSATANDHVNTPFTQTQSTTVNAGSDIALTKSASPSPVIAGGVVAYTLTLSNNGPDPASTLVITDTLPPNCSVTGSLPTGCTSSGQTITCNVAALGYPGTTNVGPIQCITGVAGGSTLTNTASVTVGAASPDNLTDNNTTSVDTPVAAGSDVSITKTKSLADPVFTGISFDFVLTTRYSGDFPTGATLTDVVPAQFTINNPASFSQNGWDCMVSGQTVNCTRTGSGSAGINQALGVVNINVTAITAVASTSNTTSISPPPGVTDPTPVNNTSTLTFQVLLYQADFSSTKTRTVPNSVAQNLPFEFTLAARNNGPASYTGTVTLTDTLPVGFRLNSYSTASGFTAANCIPASASLPADGPVTITCTRNVTNLAANTSAGSIVINVTPTGTGDLTNGVCVSTSGLGPADGNSGNNCVSNTVTSQIDPNQADIRVNKTASPATVDAGQPLTYIVEVVNAGPNTAQDVQLTDVLADLINGTIGASQGVEAQPDIDIHGGGAVIPASGSATCRIVSTGGTSARLDCTITTLPVCTAGSDCPTFTFVIRPAASANPNNNDLARTNTATAISQVTADPNLGNNSGSVTSNVSPRADMTVTKTDLPDPAPAGQQLAYTITARNNGPSTAYGVSITDTLPLDVTYVSASASNGGSCTTTPAANSTTAAGNRTLSCSWATGFGRNVQRTVSVVVRPNYITHGTQLTNDVSVATTTTETNAGNNTGQALTNVSGPVYDLLINNTDTPDPVTVGDDVTYTITVTNNGASFAENVRMVDTLPAAGLSFRSVIPITAGVICSSSAVVGAIGGTVTCDIPGLATAASAQMQVVLRGENKGTYTNSAQARFQDATADAFDPQSNNTATQPTTVRTRADVQVVSKQAVQSGTATPISQIELRHPFDWLVDVRNNGPAEADTVTFSDALPAGMELTGTPALTVTSGAFTPTAPTCTGTAGGTGFTCAITSMPAAGTASVRIPVRVITVPGSGSTTNRSTIVTTDSFDTNGGNNPNAGNNFSNGSVAVLSSALSGGVYRDNNDNGAVDAGENGIQGATITVTGTAFDSTPVSRTVLTDTSGNFSVTGLPDGFYN
ncbi:MAG TPA: SdrD B-like domain-containing protein, partial [Geobacteraceae bacterium]|nr:SdrD B-like domain-containing protein [Geobacteraceae bacterium]